MSIAIKKLEKWTLKTHYSKRGVLIATLENYVTLIVYVNADAREIAKLDVVPTETKIGEKYVSVP